MSDASSTVPSPWVARWLKLAPGGEVLDLACGRGRHARLGAALGHPVLAVDRDPLALLEAAGPGITTHCVDLEEEGAVWPFAPGRFAAIVVTNYLHRPLFGHLASAVQPGGLLIYETFALGNAAFGKPSNPAFLLAPGELQDMARTHGLHVLAYQDGVIHKTRTARVQRIVAAAPGFDLSSMPLDL
ncbi:class I SAM-dependent methyltransferase [Massilia sp. S19_KUP03_FR1]|uniref:class I SAM-dependent methyltransferase n=1 Tax=Massilia sp. S19_KUP03_FR1 TaxID=3025503 RepID=UPI002FCD0F5E